MKDKKNLRETYEQICDIYEDMLHNTPMKYLISSLRKDIKNYRNPPNDGLHFSMPEEKVVVLEKALDEFEATFLSEINGRDYYDYEDGYFELPFSEFEKKRIIKLFTEAEEEFSAPLSEQKNTH